MPASYFTTRQFTAGNSQAVRIPADMAFPPKTELNVHREGDRIIIEPKEEMLSRLPLLFAALKPYHDGTRPQFDAEERDWDEAEGKGGDDSAERGEDD